MKDQFLSNKLEKSFYLQISNLKPEKEESVNNMSRGSSGRGGHSKGKGGKGRRGRRGGRSSGGFQVPSQLQSQKSRRINYMRYDRSKTYKIFQ